MRFWVNALRTVREEGAPYVLVTVVKADGSTPRGIGTRMIVTKDRLGGTIGGGHLEYKATSVARDLLAKGAQQCEVQHFPLGPSLGQCCGGHATLHFEPCTAPAPWLDALADAVENNTGGVFVTGTASNQSHHLFVSPTGVTGGLEDEAATAAAERKARTLLGREGDPAFDEDTGLLFEPVKGEDLRIVLFGAGHVGRALVAIFGGMPCHVQWIDSRPEQFPADIPDNVTVTVADAPEYEIANAPTGAYFLVMSYSHALDFALCEKILERGDFRYLGLIGSKTKRARFENRLRHKRAEPELLQRLTCPIGIDGIGGKHPGEIAVAVAAEILQLHGANYHVRAALEKSA